MSEVDSQKVKTLVGHLFRRKSGQMVATLTRILGPQNIDLAESVVQEAMIKALKTWPFKGVPDNPTAWIISVARNTALDQLRHTRMADEKKEQIAHDIDQMATETWFDTEETLRADFRDDMLKMLFICCHPIVSRESQIALALKTLFGFSSEEISRAFLTPKTTIDQRIVRAKKTIRENNLSFDLPSGEELSQRLSVVLNVLYLIFNEGYAATSGDQLVKEDLCAEASRLALLLGKHPVAKQPRTFALVALFLLQSSRFGTRLDQENEIQLLKDQDRSKWDQELIRRGLAALELAAYGEELSKFHLEAGIAASHAIAKTYDQTNWGVIVSYYDDLIAMDSSPIIALNRAVAIFKRDGAEAGLLAIEPLKANKKLQSYFLFHATLGEFLAEAQQPGAAIGSFEMALRHANTEPEKRFITKRMGEVNTNDA